MNEENEWDHRISAGVKEGPADCIRITEAFYGPLDYVWDYPGELVPER